MKRMVLVVLLVLASPSSAGAWMLPPSPSYPPPVVYAACPARPDAGGCWDRAANTVYVNRPYYMRVAGRALGWARRGMRLTKWHEYGHVMEDRWLTDAEKAEYRAIIGVPADTPWCAGADTPTADTPGFPCEHFAIRYSWCRLPGMFESGGGAFISNFEFVDPDHEPSFCKPIRAMLMTW